VRQLRPKNPFQKTSMFIKINAWLKIEATQRTFGYYSLFICLGLGMAVIGPTLRALANQTGSSLAQIGSIFLVGAIGYTFGTLFGGRVIDHVAGHRVLGMIQIGGGVLIALIPFIHWFWLLMLVACCKGFVEGFINVGANTFLVWTHKEKASPYMNGLHFFFGLGAFLSPFLVAQVIGRPGGYIWAFLALAAFGILVGLRMLTLPGNPRPIHSIPRQTTGPSSAKIPYPLVLSAAMFLFFYVGSEVAFGGWVSTYATKLNLANEVQAAYLTSAFWLAFTIGRLLSIPAATRYKPKQILSVALVCCLFILILGILLSGSVATLWLMAIGLGFCMAPIWPTGFTLAGQSLNLTGRISGMILLGECFGSMLLPWLVGQIIATAGPRAMVYVILVSLALNLLAFIGMLRLRPANKPVST
jgi:MFS transporter, FHS family, Na+ dependent glucose transporter 1